MDNRAFQFEGGPEAWGFQGFSPLLCAAAAGRFMITLKQKGHFVPKK